LKMLNGHLTSIENVEWTFKQLNDQKEPVHMLTCHLT